MMAARALEFTEMEVPATLAALISGQCAPDSASIGAAIRTALRMLTEVVRRHNLAPTAPPRVIYTEYEPEGVSFQVAIPVATRPARPAADPLVRVELLSGVKAYRFVHHGSYETLMRTYGHIAAFMKAKGWMRSDADWARYVPMWEEYVTDPRSTPEEDLLTYIYLPVA